MTSEDYKEDRKRILNYLMRSFVTGFWVSDANRANVCGRPAGLGVTKNGSLLISDDINGVIYQINSN